MAKATKSENVPKAMQEKFDRISAITDEFCKQHLNDEYAQMIRYAIAALCRKRPSPLEKGKEQTWACGIIHAIGVANFLFEPNQDPHMKATDIYAAFGISTSTGQSKSKAVRDALGIHQLDPEWSLPSKVDDNPLVWLVMVNGLIVDIRTLPRHFQEEAYAQGVIPYIPADRETEDGDRATIVASSPDEPDEPEEQDSSGETTEAAASRAIAASPDTLYVMTAYLIAGPITEAFVKKNPEVSRTIEIKGENTLQDLHKILFKAFNRKEEHLYEFQIGGEEFHDPKARRYGVKSTMPDMMGMMMGMDEDFEDVAQTAIASLGLSENDIFAYWFDFGDDWWHTIMVNSIVEKAPPGKYPCITNKVGASPRQYSKY